MKRIIKSILFGGIFSGLMVSFTFGNNPSRVSKETNNDFSFKNDSHYIIHNDTFHFLSIEDDSNAVYFLSSPNVIFWMTEPPFNQSKNAFVTFFSLTNVLTIAINSSHHDK
jgi:hypothetical protein